MSEMPKWPDPIVRDGPYKVYKGHKYAVYDDGNSAETPYQTDLANAAMARLKVAVEAMTTADNHLYLLRAVPSKGIVAHQSDFPRSLNINDRETLAKAVHAIRNALASIGELPVE